MDIMNFHQGITLLHDKGDELDEEFHVEHKYHFMLRKRYERLHNQQSYELIDNEIETEDFQLWTDFLQKTYPKDVVEAYVGEKEHYVKVRFHGHGRISVGNRSNLGSQDEIDGIRKELRHLSHPSAAITSDENLRLGFFGDGGVGKTTLLARHIQGNFVNKSDPTILSVRTFFDGNEYLIDILDTARVEESNPPTIEWVKQCQGLVLVYSVDTPSSFDQVRSLYDQIRRLLGTVANRRSLDTPIVIVGNKADPPPPVVPCAESDEPAQDPGCNVMKALEDNNVENVFATRVVSYAEGYTLAQELNCSFIETSAKDGDSIDDLFDLVMRRMLVRRSELILRQYIIDSWPNWHILFKALLDAFAVENLILTDVNPAYDPKGFYDYQFQNILKIIGGYFSVIKKMIDQIRNHARMAQNIEETARDFEYPDKMGEVEYMQRSIKECEKLFEAVARQSLRGHVREEISQFIEEFSKLRSRILDWN